MIIIVVVVNVVGVVVVVVIFNIIVTVVVINIVVRVIGNTVNVIIDINISSYSFLRGLHLRACFQ